MLLVALSIFHNFYNFKNRILIYDKKNSTPIKSLVFRSEKIEQISEWIVAISHEIAEFNENKICRDLSPKFWKVFFLTQNIRI